MNSYSQDSFLIPLVLCLRISLRCSRALFSFRSLELLPSPLSCAHFSVLASVTPYFLFLFLRFISFFLLGLYTLFFFPNSVHTFPFVLVLLSALSPLSTSLSSFSVSSPLVLVLLSFSYIKPPPLHFLLSVSPFSRSSSHPFFCFHFPSFLVDHPNIQKQEDQMMNQSKLPLFMTSWVAALKRNKKLLYSYVSAVLHDLPHCLVLA